MALMASGDPVKRTRRKREELERILGPDLPPPPPPKRAAARDGQRDRQEHRRQMEDRILPFLRHGDVYRLLGVTVDRQRKEVVSALTKLRDRVADPSFARSMASRGEDPSAPPERDYSEEAAACVRMVNVCCSIFGNAELRRLYVGMAGNAHGFDIPIPGHEVGVSDYVCAVLVAMATRPVPWGKGFPVRTASGFAWVDGQSLYANLPAASRLPAAASAGVSDEAVRALRDILGRVSETLITSIREPDLRSAANRMLRSGAWAARDPDRGGWVSYETGLLDMGEMRFATFERVRREHADAAGMVDPARLPVAFLRHAYPVSREDADTLDAVRRECSVACDGDAAARLWTRSWRGMPGFARLLRGMPAYDLTFTRQRGLSDPSVQSCLYDSLARALGVRPAGAGGRAVLLVGPSGCAKSTCVDVVCEMLDPEDYVHVTHSTEGEFSDEATIGKRVVVYSDVCEKNCLGFEQLSNATDGNARAVNRKHASYQRCPPPSLVVVTSNGVNVVRTPRNGRTLDADAVASRVLPFVFTDRIGDGSRRADARQSIARSECFHITAMLLAHSRFVRINSASGGKGGRCSDSAFLPALVRSASAWVGRCIAGGAPLRTATDVLASGLERGPGARERRPAPMPSGEALALVRRESAGT